MNKANLSAYQRAFFEEIKYLKPGALAKMLKRYLQPGRGYVDLEHYGEKVTLIYHLVQQHMPGFRNSQAEKVVSEQRKRNEK